MGNTVIDSRGSNPLGAALEYWMGAQKQKDVFREQEEERARQEQAQRDRAIAAQFHALRPDQQQAMYANLPPGAQQLIMDPASIPPPQLTPREQLSGRISTHLNDTYDPSKPFAPDPVALGFVEPDLVGKAPFMSAASQRYNYGNEASLPPDVTNAQRVADKIQMDAGDQEKSRQWGEEFTKIKMPESTVGIRKTKAETGKIGAETGKISEETITERELRDPNSPATRARSQTGGRKSSAEIAIESANAALTKLSEQEKKLLTEVSGERAGLASQQKEASPYLRKLEAQLAQTRTMIQQGIARRDKIVAGASKAGVSTGAGGGVGKRPVEFITKAEYDALIAAGETPESIAADGLRVRK